MMVSQWIFEEILCGCIHFNAYLCAAHIDVVGVLGQGACAQVIFVQTFSATFYQSDVSRRQDSLNTDTHLCFKVIADDVLFGLCNTYGTVSKYDFVGACIDHGRVCHERSLAGQHFYGKLGKDRLQVTFTSGNDTVIVQ
mgnify:CR=1 FL=1